MYEACLCVFYLIFVLLRIGILTLFERKVLSLVQMRIGPSKVGAWGIIQPLVDGLKLMSKEALIPTQISRRRIILIPRIFFVFMIQVWASIGRPGMMSQHVLGALLVLSLLGLMVYSTLLTGVTSYSKFGIIGGMRAASQRVSYEIVLSILLFAIILVTKCPHLTSLLLSPTILLLTVWWICMVAESNRAPFDFAEGESELIRGFNIEYSSGGFIFIFLGEYGMLITVSIITGVMFIRSSYLLAWILLAVMVLLRSAYPRFRFDMLIALCWFGLLPTSLICLRFMHSCTH